MYSCNRSDKRHNLYLKWTKDSYKVQSTVRDVLAINSLSKSSIFTERLQVSFNLSKLDISQRASLVTSTIIRDISKGVAECSDSLSSFINLDLRDDDTLLVVWASSASDLAIYDALKNDSDSLTHSESSDGCNLYYFFNTSETQLWVDGAESYGLACSRNVSGSLQFSETCYIDECLSFITTNSETYSKSFVECSPLLVLWLFGTT